jgi:aspartyl-tRNA(Asn)/glutamyl-tRNA(Gln) amidotransferase subunit B
MYKIIGNKHDDWQLVVGLEVHAQVISQAKLFSESKTAFGAKPNSQVSYVDAAFPGMLPVINKFCVKQAVKTGLGLQAQVNLTSFFDRKNYFYADLPQGYQISQYLDPIIGEGKLTITLDDGSEKDIGIERLHLEQDAGKSIHDQHPSYSYVDLNRCGVALMEIVSKPDITSPEEAGAYVKTLRSLVQYLETCDGNMEEGSLRCDVNVSVRRPDQPLGTRCEIKNVNSVRFVMQAIDYEAKRQVMILEDGGTIDQETRLFNPNTGETKTMRSKEDAHDYRYFPDPDLLPLVLDEGWVAEIKANMIELPHDKKQRFMAELGLSSYDASVLVADKQVADYFEAALALCGNGKLLANWITGELFGLLKKHSLDFTANPISATNMAELIKLIADDVISGKIAKTVLATMVETSGEQTAKQIVAEKGLQQITNSNDLEEIAKKIIADNQKQVQQYQAGKDKLFGFFVGQMMKQTAGKANPKIVNDILKKLLG